MPDLDILALGFCSWDYLGVVPQVPLDGKVRMTAHAEQGGGPAATAAVAGSRLGARAAFIGKVGGDPRGRLILDEFRKEGVDVSGCAVETDAESALAFCWAEEATGHRSIAWHPGTTAPLGAAEVSADAVRSARVLHLDGNQPEAAVAAAEIARGAGVTVSLDAGTYRPAVEQLLEASDVAIASEQFGRDLTRSDDPDCAVRSIFSRGPRIAMVTLGSRGSIGLTADGPFRAPAFQVDAVDTTGAGDVFHGAFCIGILEGWDARRSARFASAAAALKCTRLGGRTGIPSRAAVLEFLEFAKERP